MIREALIALGGKENQCPAWHRVYLTDLPAWFGLQVYYDQQGIIRGGSVDGVSLPEAHVKALPARLSTGKVWFNCHNHTFHYDGLPRHIADPILNAVRRAVGDLPD